MLQQIATLEFNVIQESVITLVKRNTNISISTEVRNSTNARKQLANEETCKKETGSWGSQVSINQYHTTNKTQHKTHTQKSTGNPPKKVNSINKSLLQPQ